MKKQKKSVILIFLIVIVVFFIIYYFDLNDQLVNGIFKVLAPAEKQLYHWGLVIKRIGQLGDILRENQSLKDELSKLSVDQVKFLDLGKENDYLKKELNYLRSNKFDYLLADVVGKQLYNDQILVINKGTDQGLKENLAVTVGQGIVIGKIISVLPQRSEVRLLTSSNSELAVTLNQEAGTNGVVKGKAGNSLVMEFIPQNLKINDGDLVVTSGLEENIPRGLLVGKINGVESLVGQVFQKADVLAPFNYQNLQLLTIIFQQ